jgi:hypothetical protein
MPTLPENVLIEDADRPLPAFTYCAVCHEWLPSSSQRRLTEEIIAVLRLVNSTPALTGARVEHGDRPDVLMHHQGGVYGLEVTRIARGGSEAVRRAALRREAERKARILYLATPNATAWVSLHWHHEPPRAKLDAVARLLADEVAKHVSSLTLDGPSRITSIEMNQLPVTLAAYVGSITIARTRSDDNWVSGFANFPELLPDELQEEISRKSAVATKYPSRYDGLWLLIYAETSNEAQALDVTDDIRSATYLGDFDKVFFLDCMNRVADVRIEARAN